MPLPPNRTGGFPASGFPVDGLVSNVGALTRELWLRGTTPGAPAMPFGCSPFCPCELFQQAFNPPSRLVLCPCLARGTRGSFVCGLISLMLPSSYPPWLHGRYPLQRYYEDSDSCSAPYSTRTGILDSRTCTSGHSVSNHPMRPCLPAMLLAPGRLGHRLALCRYRQFFGLRSLLAVSSVA